LPFGDDEFDVVVCQMAMMFLPDPATALREMRRVARPSGSVGVLVPGALPANRPYELFVDIVTRHAGHVARSIVTTYLALGDADHLGQLFADAGLTVTAATNWSVGRGSAPSTNSSRSRSTARRSAAGSTPRPAGGSWPTAGRRWRPGALRTVRCASRSGATSSSGGRTHDPDASGPEPDGRTPASRPSCSTAPTRPS
jgi:hypothetical protein